MTVTNITVKASLKEPITLIESGKFLEIISTISKDISMELKTTMPQLLSFPFGDNQPAEIPFAIYQAPGQYSVILSRNGITVGIDTKQDMIVDDIRKKLISVLDKIFSDNQYSLCKKEISSISASIATSIFGIKAEYIQDFIKKADIEKRCSINKNGFCLKYTTSTVKEASSETISFASIIGENKELGIQVSEEFLLGGFDINKSTPLEISSHDIEEFIGFIDSDRFNSRVEAIYGLSRIK